MFAWTLEGYGAAKVFEVMTLKAKMRALENMFVNVDVGSTNVVCLFCLDAEC